MEATEIQPTAWGDIAAGTGGFLTTDAALSNGLTPLYDQAALDAAVAAERERCAKLCEEDAFVEQWKGLAEAARRIRGA